MRKTESRWGEDSGEDRNMKSAWGQQKLGSSRENSNMSLLTPWFGTSVCVIGSVLFWEEVEAPGVGAQLEEVGHGLHSF